MSEAGASAFSSSEGGTGSSAEAGAGSVAKAGAGGAAEAGAGGTAKASSLGIAFATAGGLVRCDAARSRPPILMIISTHVAPTTPAVAAHRAPSPELNITTAAAAASVTTTPAGRSTARDAMLRSQGQPKLLGSGCFDRPQERQTSRPPCSTTSRGESEAP